MTDHGLAERLAGGVSLISVLISEHLNCAAQLSKDGDPDARAHRDTAESLDAVLAALDGRDAGWREGAEAMREQAAAICKASAEVFLMQGLYDAARAFTAQAEMLALQPLPAPPARPRCPQSGSPDTAGEPER